MPGKRKMKNLNQERLLLSKNVRSLKSYPIPEIVFSGKGIKKPGFMSGF